MAKKRQTVLLAAIFLAIAAAPLAAQPPAAGERLTVVSGAGVVTLERPPTSLVMTVQLLGKGKDIKEALGKLKDRREAALLLLESLEADTDSVEFGEPSTSNVASDQRQQFERMVRERVMSSGRGTPKGLKIPKSVTVATTLTARWPLAGKTTEERLIETESLQEKIKAADIAGIKEPQELTPEEQELAEEMGSPNMMFGGGGDEELPPGTPVFSYAASIAPEEREAAMAEAFQKAKQTAARLAAAAGAELGPLAQLSGQPMGSSPYDSYSYRYSPRQRYSAQQLRAAAKAAENESFAEECGPVKFTYAVNAGFYLKPGTQR